MNLNKYGGACRCLLRLREDEGQPGMSDAAFIARPENQHLLVDAYADGILQYFNKYPDSA